MSWRTPADALRNELIELFLNHPTESLSGETISEHFHISRTAIWKHLEHLESLGFVFDAAPRRGYRLLSTPDILFEPLLQPHLSTHSLGRSVLYRPVIDSTNRWAMELAEHGAPHGTVASAKEQSAGKGRRGRMWASPEGGLWMTLVLTKPIPLSRAGELTLLAGVAAAQSLRTLTGLDIRIKWPNDLLLNGRKLCGILAEIRAEAETVQTAVLGIGLNLTVAREDVPALLQETMISLSPSTSSPWTKARVAGAILSALEPLYDSLCQDAAGFSGVRSEWIALCAHMQRTITVRLGEQVVTGTCVDIDERGTLTIEVEGKRVQVPSGEIVRTEVW
ncbi:MAG: biotin--[acetyl-CoA-carboxylase] ligase [Alicyclobacillaceae bacterium]|nr:biotin--[acetyl-CoA-carboxylase] ligase [Alicyclobacillaceae bacterium]